MVYISASANRKRLGEVEAELDLIDFDDPKWHILNDEANRLQTEIEDMGAVMERHRVNNNKLKLVQEKIASKWQEFPDFHEWFKWAKTLYTIDENFTVTSSAKNWDPENPKEWTFSCEADALEKIDTLITWKEYDHFTREK